MVKEKKNSVQTPIISGYHLMISHINPVIWAVIAVTHQFTQTTFDYWNLCVETPHNTKTISLVQFL